MHEGSIIARMHPLLYNPTIRTVGRRPRNPGGKLVYLSRLEELKQLFTPAALLATVTYCIWRTINYCSYVSNFGAGYDALGYVSNESFIAGANIGVLVASAIIFLRYRHGSLQPLSLDHKVSLMVMAGGYIIVAYFPELAPTHAFRLTMGIVWGLATTSVTIACLELLALNSSGTVLILQLCIAAVAAAAVETLFNELPLKVSSFISLALVFSCMPLISACRMRSAQENRTLLDRLEDPGTSRKELFKGSLRESIMPVVACAIFELIVGLVNMYAFCSNDSFVISPDGPIQGMLICAGLLILFVIAANRAPRQDVVYTMLFPLAISLFLILPFISNMYSRQIAVAMYTGYTFTATLSVFYYLQVCRKNHDTVYGMAAVSSFLIRVGLVAGLTLGQLFSHIGNGETFTHLFAMGVACAYFLGIVLMMWTLAIKRSKQQVKIVVKTVPETFQEAVQRRVDELTEEYDLCERERDVLVRLAQGNSASSIADELCLSTSTVQGYIKQLYAKLGVKKKQQVIDLFKF